MKIKILKLVEKSHAYNIRGRFFDINENPNRLMN